MEKEIKRVAVLQTGKILAIVYGVMGIFFLPFMLIGLLSSDGNLIAMLPMLIMVILYPVMGFIGGIIMSALYNLVAKWVGGLRFTVE